MEAVTFFALMSVFTQGCYEGWEDPIGPGPNGTGPSTPTPSAPSPPGPKPYVYILLTTVRLAEAALSSGTCFPPSDLKDFKNTEWTERLGAITTALTGITEKLVIKNVSINASDCTKLAGIQSEAVNTAPWLPDGAPQTDPLGRLTLHLKAVFWQGDPAATPPSQVSREDWTAFTDLKNKGIRSQSATYHVISGGGAGYFNLWSLALPKNVYKSGNPLNKIDPTSEGITARTEHIKKDTALLIQWITESFK